MRRRTRFSIGAVALAASFLVGFSGAGALAADGATMYNTVSGLNYKSFNRITQQTSTQAQANSYICSNGSNIPAGYAGANARIFKNGALAAAGGVGYNTSAFGVNACFTRGIATAGSATYWSHGYTQMWNTSGSNYVTANIVRSPSLVL